MMISGLSPAKQARRIFSGLHPGLFLGLLAQDPSLYDACAALNLSPTTGIRLVVRPGRSPRML